MAARSAAPPRRVARPRLGFRRRRARHLGDRRDFSRRSQWRGIRCDACPAQAGGLARRHETASDRKLDPFGRRAPHRRPTRVHGRDSHLLRPLAEHPGPRRQCRLLRLDAGRVAPARWLASARCPTPPSAPSLRLRRSPTTRALRPLPRRKATSDGYHGTSRSCRHPRRRPHRLRRSGRPHGAHETFVSPLSEPSPRSSSSCSRSCSAGDKSATYQLIFPKPVSSSAVIRCRSEECRSARSRTSPCSTNYNVRITVNVESSLAPLHQGTTAEIRVPSLSSVANRYIALSPGPNNRPSPSSPARHLPDDRHPRRG